MIDDFYSVVMLIEKNYLMAKQFKHIVIRVLKISLNSTPQKNRIRTEFVHTGSESGQTIRIRNSGELFTSPTGVMSSSFLPTDSIFLSFVFFYFHLRRKKVYRTETTAQYLTSSAVQCTYCFVLYLFFTCSPLHLTSPLLIAPPFDNLQNHFSLPILMYITSP